MARLAARRRDPTLYLVNRMIALSEYSPQLPDSASLRDLQRATEAARIAGCRIYHIPQDFPEGVTADDAMWHVPVQLGADPVPAVWIGYIPLPEHYGLIYDAALRKNIRLVNSLEEFRRAEEFDRFYPLLAELTAKSVCVDEADAVACEAAANQLGYPVFVKGTVQSLKSQGIEACVAKDLSELRGIVSRVLKYRRKSLGRVIIRKLMKLRHGRLGPGGFPLGREYRVFVYRERVLALGYYWEGDDDLAELSASERTVVTDLALEVSRRLAVPYVAVDVGQLETGEWKVIEVGDAQFSGLSQAPIHVLWAGLCFPVPWVDGSTADG